MALNVEYWKNNGWLWALLIITIVIVTPLGYNYYKSKSSKKISNTENINKLIPKDQKYFVLTAQQYASECSKSDDDTYIKYLGKPLDISGVVSDITIAPDGSASIILQAGNKNQVRCFVKKSAIANLKKGETVNMIAIGGVPSYYGPCIFEAEYYFEHSKDN